MTPENEKYTHDEMLTTPGEFTIRDQNSELVAILPTTFFREDVDLTEERANLFCAAPILLIELKSAIARLRKMYGKTYPDVVRGEAAIELALRGRK